MNSLKFYLRVALPNVLFFAVYLVFLFNKELFSRTADEFTWAGFTCSVLALVAINVYLNRPHSEALLLTEQDELLQRLEQVFFDKGFHRKRGSFGERVYDKPLLVSSFLTPAIRVRMFEDKVVLTGPKAKLDEVLDYFETIPVAGEAWSAMKNKSQSLA